MARFDMWRRPTGLLRQLEQLWDKIAALEAGGGGGGGVGPQGPPGEKGEKGDKGDPGNDGSPGADGQSGGAGPKGDPGERGPVGLTGNDGNDGADGDPGADGPSAYQVAVANGFGGNEAQWLASLVGAKGDKGDRGDTGLTGQTGQAGTNGSDGNDGAPGDSAYQVAVNQGFGGNVAAWLASLVGPKGDKGDTGNAGSDANVTNANVNTAIGTSPSASRTALQLGTAALSASGDFATAANGITGAERTKLSGIATGATSNATDAQLRDRSTHTGTQTAATISDFSEAVDDRVAALITPAGNLTESYDDAGNVLTYTATGSGADPWTYVRLGSDFTTSSATAVDITGMNFTPAASKRYEFEGRLRLRTATATVGAKPGLAWPTGFVDGTAEVRGATSATAEVNAFGNPNAALLVVQTALPNTTQSWPAYVGGEIEMGGSPSGTVKLQLASETAGTNVTCKAGSWLRYREVP